MHVSDRSTSHTRRSALESAAMVAGQYRYCTFAPDSLASG
jgi:hypothetical protein